MPRTNKNTLLIHGVNCGEKGDPYKIHKVPIPSPHFKTSTLFTAKLMFYTTIQVINKKTCTDQDMHSMKSGGHKKNRPPATLRYGKSALEILPKLIVTKHKPLQNGHDLTY